MATNSGDTECSNYNKINKQKVMFSVWDKFRNMGISI